MSSSESELARLRVHIASGGDLAGPHPDASAAALALLVYAGKTSAPSDPDAALHEAAGTGDADAAAIALRAGANVESRNPDRRTALLTAVYSDHLALAELLLAVGADPNTYGGMQDTPWLVTGVTGSVPMAKLMLPHKPDMKKRNRYGGVSIIPASERGHVDYVRFAAEVGVDVNHINNLHWTALLEAVILGDGTEPFVQIINILLDHGADPAIADKDGVTALQHARYKEQKNIVATMESRGC